MIQNSICEELEQVFVILEYHMKIILWELNVKLGTDDIFKPTIENKSLHQDSNNNNVRIVNIATLKKYIC
jgi:hypothetical protein